jgi:hypothetical protein
MLSKRTQTKFRQRLCWLENPISRHALSAYYETKPTRTNAILNIATTHSAYNRCKWRPYASKSLLRIHIFIDR